MKEEHWKAIIACDENFDGHFYYGVVTTGVYCKPSCKSKQPNKENVRVFFNPDSARNEGLRPCKRCRPDLLVSHSNQEQLVQQVNELITHSYTEDLTLQEVARRLFVSPFYLQRVYKQFTQLSPTQFLLQKRMETARRLLVDSSDSITCIALQAGFKNSGHFSSVFGKIVGCSPSAYRKQMIAEKQK